MIGECVAGYRLKEKLGEGGTGETYLAEHQETGQPAAVKMLFTQLSSDAELLGRYFAELRAASVINHIGIADLYDCGIHASGRAFAVMEYLQGKTLTDALIETGAISDMESLADIAWQLATLLKATHDKAIVHGALKPDGVFLTFPAQQAPKPRVKLIDFGMAKFTLNVRHSQTGSLLGAPLYMAPEIARGLGKFDHRADIYSLGCVMFEMACGRPPFVREGKGELILAHTSEPAPFVSTLEPSIPPGIDTLIGRMLTKNPAARPQTMAEVAAVLAKFFACPLSEVAQPSPPMASPAVVAPPPDAMPAIERTAVLHEPVELPRPKAAHDPTALLPPPAQEEQREKDLSVRRTPMAPKPAARSQPSTGGHPRHRASPAARPAASVQAPSSAINIPLVAFTTSAMVVIAVLLYALVIRKPEHATQKKAPIESARFPVPFSTTTRSASPPLPLARPQPPARPQPLTAEPSPATNATSRPVETSPRKVKSPPVQDPMPEPPASPDPRGPRGAKHW